MALSAQDKILYVANKLGLSSLGQMQGSTGAVYDVDTDISGQIFSSASRHQNPSVTNVTENQFEVNEALLVENIAFYAYDANAKNVSNFQKAYGSDTVILFDLVIGNKRVMKDTPVFGVGSPYTFANTANTVVSIPAVGPASTYIPRHQVFMEGAGILIPPQVQWYVDYRVFNVITGATVEITDGAQIGCYLFGTRVLLNFNTTI
jgi:hypothetical protein